jgi:predicted dehydrogenase
MSHGNSVYSRRDFLVKAVQAATVATAPLFVPGTALGKNGAVPASERIVLAGIGIGHRGSYVLSFMMKEPLVQFVAIADVRKDRREAVKALTEAKYGPGVAMYRDFQEMLPRKDIDAVLIATGDRWHAIASIMAATAGKDVYCEKPCAITIALAQDLAEAMRREGQVFQAGTQRRNVGNFRWAVELARSGKLGKLHTLYASICQLRDLHDWLPAEPEPPKDVVDWDLWLGPAPWRPYNRQYVDGGWRGYFDFDSGGRLHDLGTHTVDLCQWANDADGSTPVEFIAAGNGLIMGRYANGVKLVLRSEDGWLGLGSCPVRFEGSEGWVETGDSGKVAVYPDSLRTNQAFTGFDDGDEHSRIYGPGQCPKYHVHDFVNCVKTRAVPVANADIARKTHIACHAAYISWLLKRQVKFNPAKEEFVGDDEANRMRSRAFREPWRI